MKEEKYQVEEAGELFEFLLRHLKDSRTKIKSLLKYQCISVDHHPITQYDYRLKKGQVVSVSRAGKKGQPKELEILYEDEEFLVVNKKAGLLTIATEKEKDKTLYHQVSLYVKGKNPKNKIFIVHRLDRDTSGIVLFAKSDLLKYQLQEHWNSIVKKRGYVAVVEGRLDKKKDTVTQYLKETTTALIYATKDSKNGKRAVTKYRVLKEYKDYSLLSFELLTGRKNQIRVLMKELAHPIVGDKKYGSTKDPLHRLALHANELEFIHPVSHKKYHFEVPIPESFKM